jgi:hypothetical protein
MLVQEIFYAYLYKTSKFSTDVFISGVKGRLEYSNFVFDP